MAASPNPWFKASGKARFQIAASVVGQEKLLEELLRRAKPEHRRELLQWYADRVVREARRLVPRDTGELESEVAIHYDGDMPSSIGVLASSPAAEKARATEYGSWNYDVGSPTGPKLDWPAKSKPTAAMPWLRTAAAIHHYPFLRHIRKFFISGRRDKHDP